MASTEYAVPPFFGERIFFIPEIRTDFPSESESAVPKIRAFTVFSKTFPPTAPIRIEKLAADVESMIPSAEQSVPQSRKAVSRACEASFERMSEIPTERIEQSIPKNTANTALGLAFGKKGKYKAATMRIGVQKIPGYPQIPYPIVEAMTERQNVTNESFRTTRLCGT
jgi:hypothetical protein